MSEFALFPASRVGSCDSEAQMLQHLHSHLHVVLFNKPLNHSVRTGVAPKEGERWLSKKVKGGSTGRTKQKVFEGVCVRLVTAR